MKLKEKDFQNCLVAFFKETLGYDYKKNSDLKNEYLRTKNNEYLLKPILQDFLRKKYTENQIENALFEIEKTNKHNLEESNKAFFELLKNGIDVENEKTQLTEKIFIIDFKNPEKNHFLVVEELTFKGQEKTKRCDLVVFINGLPISIIELKKDNIKPAFHQIKNYQDQIPELFIANAFSSISDGFISKAGTITSLFNRYNAFKNQEGKEKYEYHFSGLYSKKNIIKILEHYVFFTNDNIKILANYHQFFAVEKLIQKSIKAYNENKKVGTVWHTTGAGKSFTMVFYVKQLLQELKPLVIVLTDRVDLDGQLYTTFAKSKEFLGIEQALQKINSRKDLINKLKSNTKSDVIFTTIQKFSKEKQKLKFQELSKRQDIFVIVDEAHRTQYEFKNGFAKHIRDALPNAKFVAFTGTPLSFADKNTKTIFGEYVDMYTLSDAVKDKVTVPIFYEPRLAKIGLKEAYIPKLDAKAEELFEEAGVDNEKAQQRLKLESIIGAKKRLDLVAKDFVKHYEKRKDYINGKVMFCCYSRNVAIDFYEALGQQNKEYQNQAKVIFSGASSDEKKYQKHLKTTQALKQAEKDFKNPENNFKIAIVVDMWQTGFDVPCLHTLYIDKPLKAHTLIQTISRVNRVYQGKDKGLIVDYIGIGAFFKEAIIQYSKEDQKQFLNEKEIIKTLMDTYELTKSHFKDFDYQAFLKPNTQNRWEIINDGMDFILGKEEKTKNYFLKNSLELIKTYYLIPLSEEAKKIVDEIHYFNEIRKGILKLKNPKKGDSKIDIQRELNILVSKSLETEGVHNIYDVLGNENPQIDILDETFFEEIRKMKQKHFAYEVLKKIMNDKLKVVTHNNVALQKKFSEKLQNLIKQYQNKMLTSAEIIEEFYNLSKEMKEEMKKGKAMGLSEDEKKFYDAVACINDEKEIMKIPILKDLAKELFVKIRNNKSVDWQKKEQTRAKMRIMIKKLLKKYNYPPKGKEDALELVLKQTEVFLEYEL